METAKDRWINNWITSLPGYLATQSLAFIIASSCSAMLFLLRQETQAFSALQFSKEQ
jgi:hypothetical protein